MFKKFLSLILAGVILFSGGSVAFAETTEDIRQILRLANSVTSQDEASYTDEAEAIEGTNTDAEQQATSDVTTEDENKYITWKEADEIFMSEFGDKNNYYDLFHPYVTLGGLAYRIWLTEGSPVMDDKVTNGSPSEDEKLNDFGNTWWYCALNKIIDENVLNHIVMKEDRFYSLNELRITQSDFQYIIDNYKKVRAKNSAGLRQASKPQNVKTFSNNDNKSIRSKSYADDSVIDYKITCIIGNYCIVGKPRLPDNGNILQNSYIPNNGFIVKIINNDNIADILSNQNDDCLFFHNGNVYSSIYELLREERVDSSLDLLDVFCLYYGKTSEIGDVEITIDYNNGINHFENYQNMNSINLPELTRSGYNFDGFYVCKKEIDNDGNIIVLWHCINSKGEYQWLTEETKEYKKTKLDKNTIVFNTGDESISFVAQWKTWTDAGYFTYNKNKTTKTVTITDYVGTDTDVVIPASIDGYSVTSIGSSAFSGCTRLRRLTSVTIPDSVTSIGGAAFSDCTSLTSITIPDSVTSIGDSAFNSCTSLTSITIPNSVTSIGNWAFYYCTSLTSITIPDSVTNIGYKMFSDCTSLTSITIPDSVTSIGLNAFSNCISLTNINVDSNNEEYTSIDGVLFTKNVKILVCYPCGKKDIEYIIPSSVTSISCDAFSHCKSLTSITIPDRVTSIGNAAFDSCKSLTSIIIPDGVTSIGNDAFRYCTGLTSIIIPDSVTSIGNDAFRYCTGLTSIIIPDSVTSIGDFAFSSCKSLNSINIPDSVTSIGDCAFSYCTSLTSINIPDRITSIGSFAFSDCTSLTSIIIPDSVTSIGACAFSSCTRLTSITIPNSVTSIGNDAFRNCTSLISINIPDSVTSIGDDAFRNCTSLTSVNIPNSVTSIGNDAFSNCTSLTSITIPDSVTSISSSAFSGCTSLTSINIPDSVTSIGDLAFNNCRNLKIYCHSGSYAETYAKNNKIAYVLIS